MFARSSFAFFAAGIPSIFLTILSLNVWAGGSDIGRGGDSVSLDFKAVALDDLDIIKNNLYFFKNIVDADILRKVVLSAKVEAKERVFVGDIEKDAVNYSNPDRIFVSSTRWLALPINDSRKNALALHEYLSLMGVDDSDYSKSSQLLVFLKTPPAALSANTDIFWYNENSGATDIWLLQNGRWSGSVGSDIHSKGYVAAGAVNFTGSDSSDMLFFDPTSGDVDEWVLSHGQRTGSVNVDRRHRNFDFRVIGTADFNGDGTSGVFWYNSKTGQAELWFLDGKGHLLANLDPGQHSIGYQAVGVGQLTGGKASVLFYNPSSGDVDEWIFTNGQRTAIVDIGFHPGGSAWQAAARGDFNGDGNSDLLWYNPNSGQTDIWLLDGGGHWMASVNPGTHPMGATIAGVISSARASSMSSILFLNSDSGGVDEWILSNGKWKESINLGAHPGTGWKIGGIGNFK